MRLTKYRFVSIPLTVLLFVSQAFAFNGDAPTAPIYALWNGFLSMTNVLEIVNKDDQAVTVRVTLFDISGTEVNAFDVTVASRGQQDIILNTLSGFANNSYGSVRLEFTGEIDGRISFYRLRDVNNPHQVGEYEFAYSVPFCDATTGASFVPFNTFQPSTNPFDSANSVHNWLSIFNQHPTDSKTFTVNRYDQTGNLLSTQQFTIAPRQRRDIDGGHGEGPSVVGLNEIIPEDPISPYQAQLVRYGQLLDGTTEYFSWAFPLSPVAGSNTSIWAPISSGANAQNWVEIVNVTDQAANVQIRFYDNAGNELSSSIGSSTIAPYAQFHVDASALLPAGASGAVQITPLSGEVITNSMFYFRSTTGSVNAMYGAPARMPSSGELNGSWNLYLNQSSWLRIFNTDNVSQAVTVTVENGASVTNHVVNLAPYSGTDLGLHDSATFGTNADNYGLVSITGQNLITDVLRIRPTDGTGDLDYVFPTAATCCAGNGDIVESRIPMGWNMGWINPWASHIFFVDAFKRSNVWVPVPSDLSGWDTGSEVPVDSNGYPLEIPFMADGQEQVVSTFMYTDIDGNWPSGTYTLMFEGTGSMFLSVGATDYGPFTTAGTYELPITADPAGIFMTITQSDVDDPIQNIRIISPGHSNSYLTEPFHPSFFETVNDVSVIRFMTPLRINGEGYPCDNGVPVTDPTCVSEWANRPQTNSQTQTVAKGIAYEYIIEFSNQAGTDLWVSIVHHASDDFVRSLAELIRGSLRSDLRVYVEWSNEPWSPSATLFPQSQYVQNIGVQQFPGDASQPLIAGYKYQARRSAQVFEIFDQVFAGQEDRLVHVITGWFGMPAVTSEILSGMDDPTVNPTGVRADMLAIGAYFCTHIPYYIPFYNLQATILVSEILDHCEDSLTMMTQNDGGMEPSFTTFIRDQRALAVAYNLAFGTYETGQHMAELQGFSNDPVMSPKLISANQDPRMYQIYNQAMDIWFSETTDGLLIPFNLMEYYTFQGEAFGHMEYWGQPLNEAHKYRAVYDRIQTLRQ